ncbi:LPO_1073/Vpar_1526 family protein [Providencia huaxiensis]|uniref:LPO_1073/Vpar_1526 family protein n=1 Tax=Providencia huaxiensis TaxID=2027290 RepID=UPI0024AA9999
MSLLDKNKQLVGDNSTALQAGGNLTVVFGAGEEAIKDLVARTLESQMPSLREEAKKQVDEIAATFGSVIINRLAQEAESVVIDKLKSPDIQYQINQSILQVARKGFGVKSEVLAELIAQKISTNDEEKDILIDHAFEVIPRLTTDSIKLITVIQYVRNYTTTKPKAAKNNVSATYNYGGYTQQLNATMGNIKETQFYSDIQGDDSYLLKLTGPMHLLKVVNLSMLGINGCIDKELSYKMNYIELLNRHNPNLQITDLTINTYYSTLYSVLRKFGIKDFAELNNIYLSPLGEMIAKTYLNSVPIK